MGMQWVASIPELEVELMVVQPLDKGAYRAAFMTNGGLLEVYIPRDVAASLTLAPGAHIFVQLGVSGAFEKDVRLLSARPVAPVNGKAA